MEPERVAVLAERPAAEDGRYVLYWMQQAQRAEHNHALEHAIALANQRGQRVVVAFGLTDGYPEANARHYAFMLQGLRETAATLARRGILFVLRRGDPAEVALALAPARRRSSSATRATSATSALARRGSPTRRRPPGARGRGRRRRARRTGLGPRPRSRARTLRPQHPPAARRFLQPLARGAGAACRPSGSTLQGRPRSRRSSRQSPATRASTARSRPSSRFKGGTTAARAAATGVPGARSSRGYAESRNEPAAGQTLAA